MRKQSELIRLEKKYCSWGDTVHYSKNPIIFTNCKGSLLFNEEGRSYLDLQMWYSAANFGYKNKYIAEALRKQIDTVPQLASQYLHREKIELAARIAQYNEKTFGIKGRIHFNVGGAQAVEDSLKLIRNYTKKNKVFAFMGGYHGRTLGASNITSSYRYRNYFGHFSDRAFFIPYPYCFRCFYGKNPKTCNLFCVQQFKKLFETEYYGIYNPKTKDTEFIAFYAEAIQGTGGYIIPPRNYFIELKKVLDKYNIIFVDDEIQMGFYRTGKMWAIENFGIKPDLITFGKSLTNGLNPLSGMWAKESMISPKIFPPGSTHSTFASNPLGTAAGLAVMNLIEKSNLKKDVPQKGKYMLKKLKHLQKKYPQIGNVDGIGLALSIEICKPDGFTPDRQLTHKMFELGLKGNLKAGNKKMGLILDVGGYYKNIFTIAPSLFITYSEIDLAIKLFEEALKQALKN